MMYNGRSRLILHSLLLLAITAVMSPLFAPWFNQNIGSYLPYHHHIYFNEVDINHHNLIDSPVKESRPEHDGLRHAVTTAGEPCLNWAAHVIILPALDAAAAGFAPLPLPANLPLICQITDDENLAAKLTAVYYQIEQIFLVPPDKPPR